MIALTQDEQHVLDLIRKLPAERQRLVLYELAKDSPMAWERNTAYAESQLRDLATKRNLNWDAMGDQQRQDFIEDLLDKND
jgi:hypothetical protein